MGASAVSLRVCARFPTAALWRPLAGLCCCVSNLPQTRDDAVAATSRVRCAVWWHGEFTLVRAALGRCGRFQRAKLLVSSHWLDWLVIEWAGRLQAGDSAIDQSHKKSGEVGLSVDCGAKLVQWRSAYEATTCMRHSPLLLLAASQRGGSSLFHLSASIFVAYPALWLSRSKLPLGMPNTSDSREKFNCPVAARRTDADGHAWAHVQVPFLSAQRNITCWISAPPWLPVAG
ncbi:uncharacterized protein V1518DRAFT_41719 [Limtongia smithiae]|uniref:uncharacterized protein n=1 Tax=Limtongia smithiae TaxID=1125753 RepID=UPI0034CDE20C